MRLLIASDIHGSLTAFERLREIAAELQPDMLVLLGDILYHGPRNKLPDSYNPAQIAVEFKDWLEEGRLPLICVRGNCDAEVEDMVLPFPIVSTAWLYPDGVRVFAIHGHTLPADTGIYRNLALGLDRGLPDVAQLSGHTHIPRAEAVNGVHFWNPGSTSIPKGGFPASYAVLEKGVFSVRRLDNSEEIMSDRI